MNVVPVFPATNVRGRSAGYFAISPTDRLRETLPISNVTAPLRTTNHSNDVFGVAGHVSVAFLGRVMSQTWTDGSIAPGARLVRATPLVSSTCGETVKTSTRSDVSGASRSGSGMSSARVRCQRVVNVGLEVPRSIWLTIDRDTPETFATASKDSPKSRLAARNRRGNLSSICSTSFMQGQRHETSRRSIVTYPEIADDDRKPTT